MRQKKGGRLSTKERDYLMARGCELYCKGFAQKNIAELLGVSENTVAKWRNEDEWDTKAKLHNIRPSEIKQMILTYLLAIKNGEKPPYKADDLSKVTAAFDRLNDKRKKAVYTMESFDCFSAFVLEKAALSDATKRESLLLMLKTTRTYFNYYVSSLLIADD